jgi:hypothetical protein
MALRQAASLARKKGLGQVIFASDCLSLVQCLHSEARDRSPVGILVEEIKFVVKDLTSISFIHVKRELNEAVHLLAKSCNCLNSSRFLILLRIASGEPFVLMFYMINKALFSVKKKLWIFRSHVSNLPGRRAYKRRPLCGSEKQSSVGSEVAPSFPVEPPFPPWRAPCAVRPLPCL